MKKTLIVLTIGVIGATIIVAVLLYFQRSPKNESLDKQVKTPHFLDSTPLHNEVYATQPINVTINFDFDLVEGSKISVTSTDGIEWSDGNVLIEDNKTALKSNLKQRMPDGDYLVMYTACWPDGSCHDGQFSFKINSTTSSNYLDMKGNAEVTIKMSEIKFQPGKVIISPGTKVTWTNDEDLGHFINTETHPEHTYFPRQNSSELNKDESFSVTFETLGQYNYHCSAHVPQGMLGSIIVSN